ncbi:1-acyl-sn-glycerol-3-phosphate acyltransferase [Dietzia timorensis]|nr:1-acyl-sn-glycerol-3-phosphate acyltransferase [Dietzia timorensis]
MIRRLIARAFWTFSKWRLVSEPAPSRPSVMVGAPHTSNWDFILMLAVAWSVGVHMRWMGKHSLFSGWRGPLMRALGGIPIDRENAQTAVEDIVSRLHSGESFCLVITPDGTRKGHSHWKSGFYRIARETGMPIVLCYIDRNTMTSGLGPTLELTGNVGADMDRIREFYADKSGFAPENRIEPRLREE